MAITETIKQLNSFWLGYKYTVVGMPEGISVASLANTAGLTTLGITEVVFPTVQVELYKVPSLSTIERHIPRSIKNSELILRAPSLRNTAFWDRIEKQIIALQDPSTYAQTPETIMVVEFDIRAGTSDIALDLINPLAIWICRGAQASSFIPAPANAMGSVSVPLDELRLQVDGIERL